MNMGSNDIYYNKYRDNNGIWDNICMDINDIYNNIYKGNYGILDSICMDKFCI